MSEFISQLNHVADWFCGYASAMLLQVGVLMAILCALDLLLRRYVRAVVRYWLWMLVVVKLVLPVSLSSPTGIAYWLPKGEPETGLAREETGSQPVTMNETAPPVVSERYGRPHADDGPPPPAVWQGPPEMAPEGTASIVPAGAPVGTHAPAAPALPSWQAGLLLGWLLGVLILGIWVVRRSRFVRGLVRQAEPANRQIVQILDDCRRRLQVRRPVKLGISADTVAPAVCGLLRPTILLPAGFSEQIRSRQLKAVLMHELAHVKRGDLAVNLLQTVLQLVYFYNPLVWLANVMIRRVREKAADEAVLVALGEEAPQYGSTLIDVAERVFRRPAPGLSFVGVAESRRALAGRVRHIVNRPIPRTARLGVAGFACVIAVAATLLPMAGAEPPAAIAPEAEEGSSVTGEPTDDAPAIRETNRAAGSMEAQFGLDKAIPVLLTAAAGEVPSPAELLAKLKATDALYRQGFTIAGTSVYGWPKTKHEWRLSMGNGQVALLQRAVEIIDQKENRDHPALEKLRNETLIPFVFPMVMLENAVFVTPEYCACRWCQKNPPVDLPEPGGYRLIYFMSVTSAVYTREALWVMGRGVPEHIQEITKVSRNADGTLKAAVTTNLGTGPWELTIEPGADWMIRSGKGQYCSFSNSGLKWIGRRCVPSKGVWGEGTPGRTRAVTFEQASAEPDRKFLEEVEEMMHPPYATFMPVRDERVWPPLAAEARRPEQTILPIRCKAIGHPDGKKKFEARQAAPRQAAEQFLAAFLKGDEEAARDMIEPGSRALGDLAGLRKAIGDAAALEVRGVRFAGERAVILTTDLPVGSDPALTAPVFLRLAKHGDRWLIDRIESRIEEPFTRRLTRVLSEKD